MYRRAVWIAACLVIVVSFPTHAAEAQLEAPAFPYDIGLVPPESTAVAEEGHSYLFNPAGPAFTRPSSLEFFQTAVPSDKHRGPGDGGRGVLWSLPNYRFGLQYLMQESGAGAGVFSFSNARLIGTSFAFGTNLNYHWYMNTPAVMPGTFSLRVGFMARPASSFSVGFTFDSLLSPEAAIDELRTVGRFGLAVRPFGDRFTFSADAESQVISLIDVPTASFLGTVRLEPVLGLRLDGTIRINDVVLSTLKSPEGNAPEWIASVGVTLRFGKMTIGDTSYVSAGNGGGQYAANTLSFGGHGNRYQTALRRGGLRGEVWEVSLRKGLRAPPYYNVVGSRPDHFPLMFQVVRLREAIDNPRVKAVVLSVDDHDGGLAEVQEIRDLVAQLRRAGKPVFAYLHNPTTKDVYLASGCTRVVMHPAGVLRLEPPHQRKLYVAGLLEKVGVEAEILRREGYKASPEQLTATSPSEQTIEMARWVLQDLQDQVVEGIVEGRGVSMAVVASWFDQKAYTAASALDAGIVDEVAYPDEMGRIVAAAVGKKLPLINDNKTHETVLTRWGPRNKIVLVYLGGAILRGTGTWPADMLPRGAVHSEAVVRELKRLSQDGAVKAVVIRVDSPGGDLLASDEIWRAVGLLQQHKPVIVSLAGVAASGGYYVALPGDVIVAEPATLTGSIGVFTGKWNAGPLLERLGVNVAEFRPPGGPPPLPDFSRPWTSEERAMMDDQLSAAYEMFLDKVAQGRGLSTDEVRAVSGGRVWTGRQALERRLVDEIGGLDDAIRIARERAAISTSGTVIYDVWPRRSLRETVLDNMFGERNTVLSVGRAILARWLNAAPGTPPARQQRAQSLEIPTTP